MKFGNGWRPAAATSAAAAGICFASGRTAALFFSQTGRASWAGVAAAAAVYALALCGACRLAQNTGARTVTGLCMRSVGAGFGSAIGIVCCILRLIVACEMLRALAGTAALALPVKNARPMGVLFALALAFLLCMRNQRGLAYFGAMTVVFCSAFFVVQWLDPRPVRFYRRFETAVELDGSFGAAVALGLLLGSFCALASAETAARQAHCAGRPFGFGLRCGGLLLMMLVPANAALLGGGEKLLSQALPGVVMAARQGKAGFCACTAMMYLSAAATLAAVVCMPSKHDKKSC